MSIISLSNAGIICVTIGGLMTAFSVGKPRNGGITWTKTGPNGKKETSEALAINHPKAYRYGLILVSIGSLLQLKF